MENKRNQFSLRSPSRVPYRTELIPVVCVECLIGKQKKPILFKVTEPSSRYFTDLCVFPKYHNDRSPMDPKKKRDPKSSKQSEQMRNIYAKKESFSPHIYVVLEIRISTNCDCGQKNVKRQFFAIFESGNLNIHSNGFEHFVFRNIRIWKDCFSQFDHVTS